MTVKYYDDIEQGSQEWLDLRCGLLTASNMKLIVTPTLKIARNEKVKTHLYELGAQRVNKYVEDHYQSFDMLKGHEAEIIAREIYSEKIAPVKQTAFITNDKWGFTLGYSPDGLVGEDGAIEIKRRLQKYQMLMQSRLSNRQKLLQ